MSEEFSERARKEKFERMAEMFLKRSEENRGLEEFSERAR